MQEIHREEGQARTICVLYSVCVGTAVNLETLLSDTEEYLNYWHSLKLFIFNMRINI